MYRHPALLQSAHTNPIFIYTISILLYLEFYASPNPTYCALFYQILISFPMYSHQTYFLHNIYHKQNFGGSNMSDLTSCQCGCGNDSNCCSSLIWLIILFSICGNGNNGCGNSGSGFLSGMGIGCGCDIIIILLLLFCCGGSNSCC